MPGKNGTGPSGVGPMTGRGMGNCAGNTNFVGRQGCGMGLGRGMGRGRGRGFGIANSASSFSATQELDSLNEQSRYLKESLKETQQRIDDLQSGK